MLSVSIIIPTYKRVDQTKRTVSLLYQSKGWNSEYVAEVIIADSTEDDSIKNILSQFSNPTPIYIKPEIPGIASNKNAGARQAKYDLVIFCDSDMEVESDTLLNSLMYLRDHPTAGMAGGRVIWKGGEKDGQNDRPRSEDRMEKIGETTYVEALYSRFVATYKKIFWEAGGYDETIFNMRGEGSDLSIRYWRSGFPLTYDEKIRVHHVYEATDAATRHITSPERGIIRDLIQLGYKYGMMDGDNSNFAKTLNWLTDQFGENDKYVIIESVVSLLSYFWENRERIEKGRQNIPNVYDFKFLDVFSKKDLFADCIGKAAERVKEARNMAFGKG